MSDYLQLLMWDEVTDFSEKNIKNMEQLAKRNWENAFQRWSDKNGMDGDGTDSYGNCGFGAMCDYCEDNSYGRPCVRALNAWLRDKHKRINYSERDFKKVWRGDI